MNKLLLTFLLFISFPSFCFAALPLPKLVCDSTLTHLEIGICGIRGCDAEVTRSTSVSLYNVKRLRVKSGALTYVPGPHAKANCTFAVSALRFGQRTITNKPVCAPDLRGAHCKWIYP